jgi:hypothetical protein
MREMKNACRSLIRKPEEMGPLEGLKLSGGTLKWAVQKYELS